MCHEWLRGKELQKAAEKQLLMADRAVENLTLGGSLCVRHHRGICERDLPSTLS
jgi:hypothetical protein